MLITHYCRVVSVTVGGPESLDNGQDIELLQIFCRIRCKFNARSRHVEKLALDPFVKGVKSNVTNAM